MQKEVREKGKRRFGSSSKGGEKKSKMSQGETVQEYQRSGIPKPRRDYPTQSAGMTGRGWMKERHFYCKRFGKDHPGVDCIGMPVESFNCGKKGHRSFECQTSTREGSFRPSLSQGKTQQSGIQESKVKTSGESKSGKLPKAPSKPKSVKLSNPKHAMVAGSKKGKDGKDISSSSVISNCTSTSRAKQPSAPIEKSKSFNERKTGECNSKREPSVVKVNHDKHSGRPDTTSSSVAQREDQKEKPLLKPLKKGPPKKSEASGFAEGQDGMAAVAASAEEHRLRDGGNRRGNSKRWSPQICGGDEEMLREFVGK
nr:protein WVD2-like 5 isoform X1 [Ipomoea batatas]